METTRTALSKITIDGVIKDNHGSFMRVTLVDRGDYFTRIYGKRLDDGSTTERRVRTSARTINRYTER